MALSNPLRPLAWRDWFWVPVVNTLLVVLPAPSLRAADGDLDVSFGTNGIVRTTFKVTSADQATGLLIQPNGRIVLSGIAGVGQSGDLEYGVARYTTNGQLDPSFGTNGLVTSGGGDNGRRIAIQSDGKLVQTGFTSFAGQFDFMLVRYLTNGTVDASFGSNGVVRTDFKNGSDDRPGSILIQSDGKIVTAGSSESKFAMARYDENGNLDAAFGQGGLLTANLPPCLDLALQPDGKFVAALSRGLDGNNFDYKVARITPGGALDGSFGSGGQVTTSFGGNFESVNAVTLQSDGKIVAAGKSTVNDAQSFAVARYLTNGTLDATFGTGGKVLTSLTNGSSDEAFALAMQSDGKIVAAGLTVFGFADDFAVVRYLHDGTPDPSFALDGRLRLNAGSGFERAFRVAIQNDGKIVAAGFSSQNTQLDFAVVRLLAEPEPSADLVLTKTAQAGTVTIGSNVLYTLIVSNRGPVTAGNVVLTDTLPPGLLFQSASGCGHVGGVVTCDLGDLAAGDSDQIQIVALANAVGSVTNTASVTNSVTDFVLGNNIATAVTRVSGPECPDLTGVLTNVVVKCKKPGTPEVACSLKGLCPIQNIGTTNAGPSILRFYLSSNATLDNPGDTLIAESAIKGASLTKPAKGKLKARLPTGVEVTGLYVIAVIDAENDIAECVETNNLSVLGPLP